MSDRYPDEEARVVAIEAAIRTLDMRIDSVTRTVGARIDKLASHHFELASQLADLRALVASGRMPEPSDPVAALEQLEALVSQERPSVETRSRSPSRGDNAATNETHPMADRGTSAPSRLPAVGARVAVELDYGMWRGTVVRFVDGGAIVDCEKVGRHTVKLSRVFVAMEGE